MGTRRKPRPKSPRNGANGREEGGGRGWRMECRQERRETLPLPSSSFVHSTPEELFEQSTSSSRGEREGCDGGIFLDSSIRPSFLRISQPRPVTGLLPFPPVEYARFHAKSSSPRLYGPPYNRDIGPSPPFLNRFHLFPPLSFSLSFLLSAPTILSYFPCTNPVMDLDG